MSFRRGLFPDVFQDDFFADPFGHMDQMMSSFFSDPFLTGAFAQPAYRGAPQPEHSRLVMGQAPGPVIEEVDDEADNDGDFRSEPIVEEPGDDYHNHSEYRQQQRQQDYGTANQHRRTDRNTTGIQMNMGLNGFPNVTMFGSGAGTSSFSYSSSYSSSSFGPGHVYSSTTTTRMGPGGVRETQSTVRDGHSGREEILISRGIGDRERTITRRRNASGQEEQIDTLQNIASEEAVNFDQEWMHHAERNLPNWGGGFGASLPPGTQRVAQPQLEYRRPRRRYA